MSRVLLVIISAAVVLLAIFAFRSSQSVLPEIKPLPSTTASPFLDLSKMSLIAYGQQSYYYSFQKITDPDKLYLYPNHQQQQSSQELVNQHQCSFLTNAGFYDQSHQPLGWLVSQFQLLNPSRTSDFFNAYFYLDQTPVISRSLPQSLPRFGLQSGPLLIFDQQPLNLNIINDLPRRRMITAINSQKQIFFITIISPESSYSGPLLDDTPAVTKAIADQLGETFVSALNLDGGSASAFYTADLYLKEYVFIGSYFCYN